MVAKSIKVDILDGQDKVLKSYTVDKLTIGTNSRRLALTTPIMELDEPETIKMQKMMCIALSCTLRNGNGKLVYPDDDGWEKIYDNMDIEEYQLLSDIYMEINPSQNTLKAKKKRS